MPFNPNAAELQRKFERILVARVVERKCAGQFSSIQVAEFFSEDLVEPGVATPEGQLKLTPDELDFLKRNVNNYLTRAKNSGLLISHGTRKGYGVASVAAGANVANASAEAVPNEQVSARNTDRPSPQVADRVRSGTGGREHRESFLHMPFTLGLMRNFIDSEAIVYSMPRVTSHGGVYSNPDAIMIRKNDVARRREDLFDRWQDGNLGPGEDLKRLIQNFERQQIAPFIVSSLEYKFFYQREAKALRRDLTTALIEAQMNSSWANEAWLVYYVEGASAQHRPDADVTKLAESMGVGMLQAIERDGEFEFVEWVRPRLSESLNLHAGHVELMASLSRWTTDFERVQAEEWDDDKRAHVHSLQAMQNLFKQDGFTAQPAQSVRHIVQAYPSLAQATMELFNSLSVSEDERWFQTDLLQLIRTNLPEVRHAEYRLADIKECLEALGPQSASVISRAS